MTYFSKIISVENPVFCGFLTHGSVLVLKMMLMAVLTGRQRRKHGVLTSPEDSKFLKEGKFGKSNEDVERVRRAHLNDLENIPLFFFVGFAYLFTEPNEQVALNLFRLVTLSRCVHTFVYAICVIPQPARGISWSLAYLATGYMAIRTICYFGIF